MHDASSTGFMNAMAAATYLVGKGVPFRKAHEVVANAVRVCVERECELGDLPLAELKAISPEFEEDFYKSVALEAVLDCHDVMGGTARARVAEALKDAKQRIEALGKECHARA